MPRTALNRQQVQAYRGRIAQAGAGLLSARGESALSMRAVAEVLDVSAMTLYRYVKDKRDLMVLVRERAYDALTQSQQAAAGIASDPIRRLHRLARALVSFAHKQPYAYQLLFRPDSRDRQCLDRAKAPMLAAFTEAVGKGRLVGDPATLTDICFAALHGLECLHTDDADRTNALGAHALELLLAATTPRVKQTSEPCPAV